MKFDLAVHDFAADSFAADLSKALAAKFGAHPEEKPSTDDADAMAALVAQAVALAASHKLTGPGEIELVRLDDGAAHVAVKSSTHALGQPLETARVKAAADARTAEAKAQARLRVVRASKDPVVVTASTKSMVTAGKGVSSVTVAKPPVAAPRVLPSAASVRQTTPPPAPTRR